MKERQSDRDKTTLEDLYEKFLEDLSADKAIHVLKQHIQSNSVSHLEVLRQLDGVLSGTTNLQVSTNREDNMMYDSVHDRWVDVKVASCCPNEVSSAGYDQWVDSDVVWEERPVAYVCPDCNQPESVCDPPFSCNDVLDPDLRNAASGHSNKEDTKSLDPYLEWYHPDEYAELKAMIERRDAQKASARIPRVLEPRAWNAHNFGIVINPNGCPICAIARGCSSAVLSPHGIVPRDSGERDRPIQRADVEFGDAVYCGTSAAFNWKERKFLPFGRELPLPFEEYPPVHNLSWCQLIYLSDFVTRMRNSVDQWSGRVQTLPMPAPCGTVSTRMIFSKDHRKAFKMVPISQYVGVAVALPSFRVRGNKTEVRHFYDWARGRQGLQEHVVDKRTKSWRGVCPPCATRQTQTDSLTHAAIASGAPDPLLRINDDYIEDIIEQAIEAEASDTFRLFIVEPVVIKNLDRTI